MPLTADTITDEQIRALRLDPLSTIAERRWCAVALDEFGLGSRRERRRMRARCAEIINARSAKVALDSAEAVRRARSGAHEPYDGALRPDVGCAIWDAVEGVWAVRLLHVDESYSCGFDCCGIAQAATVAVRYSGEWQPPGAGDGCMRHGLCDTGET